MKKIEYLPSSLGAVEHLRCDVDTMSIKFYTIPEAPPGIFHPKLAEKCYTFAAGVSGCGPVDYLVYMAFRPDWAAAGDGKVLDIDTAAFCFKTDSLSPSPSGVALFHQNFSGRTSPLPGYEAFTLEQTVNDLHSKLIPGSIPLSSADSTLVQAMAHSIGKYNQLLGPQVESWKATHEGGTYAPHELVDIFQTASEAEEVPGSSQEPEISENTVPPSIP